MQVPFRDLVNMEVHRKPRAFYAAKLLNACKHTNFSAIDINIMYDFFCLMNRSFVVSVFFCQGCCQKCQLHCSGASSRLHHHHCEHCQTKETGASKIY